MEKTCDICKHLEPVKDRMASIAVKCIESFLHIKSEVRESWNMTDQLQGTFDYIFMLDSSNDQYESTLCIGAPVESMVSFFDCSVTLEEAKDAVAELANIFCAVLMDIPDFTKEFGILVQNTPEEAVNQTFFPKQWGVEGKVWYKNDWIYFGYSIGKNKFAELGLF